MIGYIMMKIIYNEVHECVSRFFLQVGGAIFNFDSTNHLKVDNIINDIYTTYASLHAFFSAGDLKI